MFWKSHEKFTTNRRVHRVVLLHVLTSLNLPHYLCQPGPGFPMSWSFWSEARGDCSFCWYWWNCWPSHLHTTTRMAYYLMKDCLISFLWFPLWKAIEDHQINIHSKLTFIWPCGFIKKLGWPSWPWSYGSWIYNYLCNQCLSPLMLWVQISIRARRTTLCDKVCQWLATGWWFFLGPPFSTTIQLKYCWKWH
jgi:hypothetical protein